jgi:hypothetical protein
MSNFFTAFFIILPRFWMVFNVNGHKILTDGQEYMGDRVIPEKQNSHRLPLSYLWNSARDGNERKNQPPNITDALITSDERDSFNYNLTVWKTTL